MTGAVVDWDHVVGIPVPALDSGSLSLSQRKTIANIERATSNIFQFMVVIPTAPVLDLIRGAAGGASRLTAAVMNSLSSSIQPFLDTPGGGE